MMLLLLPLPSSRPRRWTRPRCTQHVYEAPGLEGVRLGGQCRADCGPLDIPADCVYGSDIRIFIASRTINMFVV